MTSPRLTVVIPTRERCDTLAATLQSCVDQDSDDLDILVSDCASRDGTRDVVATFNDPRLRYVNPGESLPMTRHWEFALSHVPNGGWVTYLGDDDALMPNAARDILALLTDTHAQALSWLKAEYCWPDHIWPAYRDRLIVPLDNQLHRMPAISARNDAARFWLGYNKLPCIYNGVLPRDAMAAISAKHGRFFDGFAPDAFSGIAILSMIDSYLYSTRPFSVNGASRHSNGTAVVMPRSNQASADRYIAEAKSAGMELSRIVMGSSTSFVADAFREANRSLFGGALPLDESRTIRRAYRDLSRLDRPSFDHLSPQLEALGEAVGRGPLARRLRRRYRAPIDTGPQPLTLGLDARRMLTLDAGRFAVRDANAAGRLVGTILGDYRRPGRIKSYRWSDKIVSRVLRKIESLAFDRTQ